MTPEQEAVEAADKYVYNYVHKQLAAAYLQVEKERGGCGCGCLKCAHVAVDTINSWVDWISVNEDMWAKYRYQVTILPGGAWRILAPGEE